MGRWVTSKGRRIYIPDEGEENPFAANKVEKGNTYQNKNGAKIKVLDTDDKYVTYRISADKDADLDTAGPGKDSNSVTHESFKNMLKSNGYEKSNNKLDFSSNGTYNFKGQAVPKDLPRVSDNEAGHNKVVEYQGTKYQTQQVRDWDRNANKDYVAGHLYVPQNTLSKGSFFVSKDNKIWHDGYQYLQNKAATEQAAMLRKAYSKDVTKMSYKELEKKVVENRTVLRSSKDPEEKRRLIKENHEMMTEMDKRWNK